MCDGTAPGPSSSSMSSSPPTAPGSRSASPETPGSSHDFERVVIQRDSKISPWLHSPCPKALSTWDIDENGCFTAPKDDEQQMLPLDDLIQEYAYEDSSSPSQFACISRDFISLNEQSSTMPMPEATKQQLLVSSPIPFQQNLLISAIRPMPPPATRPRKRDLATISQRVVYPPKESCFGMRIMVPSIPEGGTKSRVETQIRVTVDLTDVNSLSSCDPTKYDRIGSWKWLKLPPGTATKRRTRKQGKIDPHAQDILYLTATVTCASPPQNRVLSCSSCQAREAKRVARKLATRVRPVPSDTDSVDESSSHPAKPKLEDTTSILQFNCAEILDFSTGSAFLPLRITCYCRHHREKVGFIIHFTMIDGSGRIVGSGSSRPIMITDDHKTSGHTHKLNVSSANGIPPAPDFGWSGIGPTNEVTDSNALSSHRLNAKESRGQTRKRAKPYDNTRTSMVSREASVSTMTSPTTSSSPLPATRSPTPPYQSPSCTIGNSNGYGNEPILSAELPALVSVVATRANGPFCQPRRSIQADDGTPTSAITPSLHLPYPISITSPSQVPSVHPIPFLFFDPTSPRSVPALPTPKIHRLIPACGPTHGGIEVTVLGANFHTSLQLNCVFGDVPASFTQRWSDNTLVCVLPPRVTPGLVAVWLDGYAKTDESDNIEPNCFTYSDESDKALMELALRVVGLTMTGKYEDPKDVAMRIIGNAGDSADSRAAINGSHMMQLASSSASPRDIRQLLLSQVTDSDDFETLIVHFLSILDTPLDRHSATSVSSAISHQTPDGQTLLHLACFLGYPALVKFLLLRDVDVDARDRNGLTALHLAVLVKSKECARLLIEAGADMEVVNASGRTAQEEAPVDFFDDISLDSGRADSYAGDAEDDDDDDDDESRWGDAEEDAAEVVARSSRRSSNRRFSKHDIIQPELPHELPEGVKSSIGEPPDPSGRPKVADEKQAASLIDLIQRTVAQLHAQSIIPNMPQLPLPHIPQLPGMPAVPWGALPQIPMVFPIFVPMPAWPSFLGEKKHGRRDTTAAAVNGPQPRDPGGSGAIKTAQDWVNTWMALAIATATRQQNEEVPPPVYSPRRAVSEDRQGRMPTYPPIESRELASHPVSPSPIADRTTSRRVGYDDVPVPVQEVNAYGYQPTGTHKLQKKKDRMLMIFWLPILILSLLWTFHSSIQFIYRAAKTASPLKLLMRG